jgi:hypothetical protein
MLMASAMLLAVAGVALVGFLLVHGAQDRPDRVSDQWRDSYTRDRRDDA